MAKDKIGLKLLKDKKKKLQAELDELTGKTVELQGQVDKNNIEAVTLQAEITQLKDDIDKIKGA